MKFIPHNNTALLKRTLELEQYQNDSGLILKKDQVDLYKVVALSPPNESKVFPFQIGDIVTACATGTPIVDPETKEKFVLMNMDYITSQVCL